MSTLTATRPRTQGGGPTLRQLALADARRYAHHPLFLLGLLLSLGLNGAWVALAREPDPLAATIIPAFFLGVLGFVVAHRLTTSLRPTHELVDASPSSRRRRTLALCLACGVPLAAGVVCTVEVLLLTAAYPPVPVPAGAPMFWFGHGSWSAVVGALVAMGPVACLGGPLLGVLVATWAPFRGSALVGAVLLLVATSVPASSPSSTPTLWRVLPPFAALTDEHAVHGNVVSSTLVPGVSPTWYLGYVVLLCALAVVAALLHERGGRGPLLGAAAALGLAAAGALALTVG
jgi:hypothetical protein